MRELSWHTHQINLWIALSKFQPTFSTTLGEIGYECDVIEERLYLHDGDGNDIIHPDVVLTESEDSHSLVVDCKSEEVDPDQLRRYLRLNENEDQLVIQGLVNDVESDNLTADTVLSSFSELSGEDVLDEFAIVHFDQDPYSGLAIWNLDGHEFEDKDVKEQFPINIKPSEPLPTGHYPFDIYEADKEAMVSNIFSTVISLSMKEGELSIDDILDHSHPYWDKLGQGKRDELRDRVEIIYLELLNSGLNEYLEKIAGTEGREWRRTSKTIQAVQRETDYYVNEVLEELPQARLDHDAWSSESSDEDNEE
ncbi:hypothetical protein [Natrinema saccharevitans]|uniref:hypothetical protein n=1 Tax=Natrinema saccharevitans TaxID=301967 RepID=UPI0011158E94|nr:hypothetical protein [Natrinema saccharevitans]